MYFMQKGKTETILSQETWKTHNETQCFLPPYFASWSTTSFLCMPVCAGIHWITAVVLDVRLLILEFVLDFVRCCVYGFLIAVLTMSLWQWGAHWLQYWQWVCEEHTDSSTDNESVRSTTFFGFGLVSSCVTVSVAVMSACASLWFVVWAQVSTRCCYDNGRLVWLFCLRAWYA